MERPNLGWAQAPSKKLWHRVRAVSEADGLRATMLHGTCGLAFISDEPLELTRPKGKAICHHCVMADDAEYALHYRPG